MRSMKTNCGVKQGCVLSPTVFLVVLDEAMKKFFTGKKRAWNAIETYPETRRFTFPEMLFAYLAKTSKIKKEDK